VAEYLTGLFGLGGRTAVVTGASSGIGRAIAQALAAAGGNVVLLGQRAAALAEATEAIRVAGGSAAWRAADLGDRDALARVAEEAAEPYGEPDILVNAAGVNPRPPLGDVTGTQWDLIMAVNLDAPFLLGQRFGPGMAARGWGRIVNILSQQSFRAFGNSGAYGASKAGLLGLTRSQAEAWSRSGVCANAIAPGIVLTPMTAPLAQDTERWAALAARTMIGRHGEPADFAGAAVFLASEAARYITGQTIFVDGGFSAT
jgi:NAD(P)-dependent dehydrogenase (short-subunit alcohol dehydrogenase family)